MANLTEVSQEQWTQRLTKLLSQHTRFDAQGHGRASAVLVPIFWQESTPYLLLSKRTCQVEHHKGEISFPGGAKDAEDPSLLHTMWREAQEEIGIGQADITLLGMLDDSITLVSNFVITPFVGVVPFPYSFRVAASEIEELLHIPLAFFSEHQDYWEGSFTYESQNVPSHFYRWQQKNIVWGATARIINNLCEILRGASDKPKAMNGVQ